MLFLLTYIDVGTVKVFPPAESWLVNSNFRRASRMQGNMEIVLYYFYKVILKNTRESTSQLRLNTLI